MVLARRPRVLSSEILSFTLRQERIFSALGRKGAVRILEVLLSTPGHEHTAREIATTADVPTMSCSRILHEFHDLRIVKRRKIGRAFALSLDEDSPATRFLLELIRLSRYD